MEPPDLRDVLALEGSIFPEPWPEQVFRQELAGAGRVYLVAEEEGQIIGYAGLMIVGEDAHITTIAVTEQRRAQGLGSRLMLALVDAALASKAKHLTLEVRVSNQEAQRFYRRFGMAPVGVRRNYYGTEDALVMWAHEIDGTRYRALLDRIRSRQQ
jgi:ribosomal-protein-alanine N-acetyltransferase